MFASSQQAKSALTIGIDLVKGVLTFTWGAITGALSDMVDNWDDWLDGDTDFRVPSLTGGRSGVPLSSPVFLPVHTPWTKP